MSFHTTHMPLLIIYVMPYRIQSWRRTHAVWERNFKALFWPILLHSLPITRWYTEFPFKNPSSFHCCFSFFTSIFFFSIRWFCQFFSFISLAFERTHSYVHMNAKLTLHRIKINKKLSSRRYNFFCTIEHIVTTMQLFEKAEKKRTSKRQPKATFVCDACSFSIIFCSCQMACFATYWQIIFLVTKATVNKRSIVIETFSFVTAKVSHAMFECIYAYCLGFKFLNVHLYIGCCFVLLYFVTNSQLEKEMRL